MAADEKWYFTKEQLKNTPSRRCGIDADKELSYRQQAANFIQDMGQRLVVSQLCINTAIVYMHRFYVFHSLSQFHRNAIAAAALFLAAKVEEQPRKLEHVIKMAHMCLHRDQPPPDTRSEQYLEQAQDLVFNENVLLQTLGFDVAIDHPHTHVVRCCQLVKASKDLAQTSYFMASNSLHLTTMCLQYKPTVVACFCIHLACKWSSWEIPQSSEGKHWFWYVDKTVTAELLQQLTAEFLHIFDKCPSRLKRKILSISANQSPNMSHPSLPNSPFDTEPRKIQSPATVNEGGPMFHSNRQHHNEKQQDEKKNVATISTRPPVDYREYREKKEREKLEREKVAAVAAAAAASSSSSFSSSTTAQNHSTDVVKHHSHHHKTISAGNAVTKHPLQSGQKAPHHNHHHRPEMKVSQSVQQRHSSGSSQQRDPNRDPTRQRLPRDYNSTGTTIHSSSHGHQATTHPPKEANLETPQSVDPVHRTESVGSSQESQEKSSGSHRFGSVDNKLASSTHDKQQRGYDPRHKPPEHRKEADQKSYSKYPELSRVDRQRKPPVESLEQQRCEEVRKLLIEKPHQPPKSTLELPPYSQKQQQQQQQSSHHNKYPQSDKHAAQASGITDLKMNVFVSDKSPSTSQKQPQQQQLPPQQVQNTSKQILSTSAIQGIPQILKDTIKNGSSQSSASSLNNLDDPKAEKRPRHEDVAHETSQNSVHATPPPPPSRHKSLFSPEKSTSHSQRSKSRQKTPPSAAKAPKPERIPPPTDANVAPSFTSPPPPVNQEIKRSSDSSSGHKKHKPINPSDLPEVKVKVEDIALGGSLEAMKMLGRIPELIQPIRDNPLASNGRGTSVANDLKPPELIKPFEPEPIVGFSQQQASDVTLTNGLDIKTEPEESIKVEDQSIKQETDAVVVQRPETPIKMDHPPIKVEYLSPMKSAQSISALLQEPLAPIIPSLLQQSTTLENQPRQQEESKLQVPQQTIQQQQQQQLVPPEYSAHTEISNESTVISTVDMSVLSVPPTNSSSSSSTIVENVPPVPVSSTTIVPPIVVTAPTEEKRSEHHHKSEKKKKKDKHKRKDKDKSKEKHKHKHKDKDKDKHHRDKEKDNTKPPDESIPTIPIKITIPKDKLNLSTDSATAALRCKIKLSKERHKGTTESNLSLSSTTGAVIITTATTMTSSTSMLITTPTAGTTAVGAVGATAPAMVTATPIAVSTSSISSATAATVVQAPLKIKIRTDSISRSGLLPPTNPDHHSVVVEGRKRPASDVQDHSPMPSKKQATQQTQPHRSGERQNGRHYSGSNNKVRGAGRGGGGRQFSTGRGCPPPPSGTTYATSQQQQQQLQRDGYNYRQDYSGNSLRSCSSHPPPRLSHPSDGGGGGGGGGVGVGVGVGVAVAGGGSSNNNNKNNNSSNSSSSMTFRRSGGAPPPAATRNNSMPSDSAFFFTNFPPPNIYPAGYMYDPAAAAAAYYQQYQQQYGAAAAAYSATTNLIIDTSVPPPSMRQPTTIRKPNSPPPLPSGPPPGSSPPPPPPPPE